MIKVQQFIKALIALLTALCALLASIGITCTLDGCTSVQRSRIDSYGRKAVNVLRIYEEQKDSSTVK
jgi:hypothetical protein